MDVDASPAVGQRNPPHRRAHRARRVRLRGVIRRAGHRGPHSRLVGTLLGPVLGDPRRLGLDAAFPALFTALLWPMLSARHAVRCAIGGALVAFALAPFTPPGVPLAGAALVGLWLAR